jgi:hypothetical protein
MNGLSDILFVVDIMKDVHVFKSVSNASSYDVHVKQMGGGGRHPHPPSEAITSISHSLLQILDPPLTDPQKLRALFNLCMNACANSTPVYLPASFTYDHQTVPSP